ncbi:hypothetical protein LH392_03190 [Corynebacterium uberis]|uniref:hypothetical protein n=1 Tax=Corynebacterium uberis TaxID=2883169 RepID=UPI001D0A467A|nr:hypothetical protein [Corynebacterium uberis]UDL80823.1 hypothetical protein LH392_03190 [Corynebacterium uberis]
MTVPDSAFARFLPAAYEGAHVRAIAGGVGAAAEQLAGLNPRSIVVIATDGLAQRCAQAGGDLLAPLPVPYVVTATLPPFVGALDVVIVVGDRGESPDAEQAVRVAARRGAATVLICPDSGPLRDDAPSSTVCLPIPVSATDRSPLRFLVGIYTVVALLSEDPDLLAEQLRGVADLVDEELAACAPRPGCRRQSGARPCPLGAGGIAPPPGHPRGSPPGWQGSHSRFRQRLSVGHRRGARNCAVGRGCSGPGRATGSLLRSLPRLGGWWRF